MDISGRYRHFKGKEYEVIGESMAVNENTPYVLYYQFYYYSQRDERGLSIFT